jgi:hypothetical protein
MPKTNRALIRGKGEAISGGPKKFAEDTVTLGVNFEVGSEEPLQSGLDSGEY